MGERQGEELEECTPSSRERHRKVGGGGGGLLAALKTLWILVLNQSVLTPVDAQSPE